jgi:hypothetical protein
LFEIAANPYNAEIHKMDKKENIAFVMQKVIYYSLYNYNKILK